MSAMDQYTNQMEEIRTTLLAGIPRSLLEASESSSGQTNDSDLDAAMEFLDARAPNQEWKHSLAKYIVLKQATTNSKANPADLESASFSSLLEKSDLLQEMLIADGPSGGNWPGAAAIYNEIHQESDGVHDTEDHPVLHRLAVAIALVHATPMAQTNPVEHEEGCPPEEMIDPVRRYLNYEIAYLEGDLDPAFSTLTTWELRFVVDGDESDEIAAWGRATLKNYYPDHALRYNSDWFYANIVRTDIPYGSARVKDDDPKLHKYQNILRNGGICGRRAFFGRFVLRAFGIPTTARPSKGHAALCHWTGQDTDWVVNLGAGWGKGWTWTRYVKDLDFLATTRARRRNADAFHKLKLAQCLGDLFGEKKVYGVHDEKEKGRGEGVPLDLQRRDVVGLWYRLSLKVQDSILNDPPTTTETNARSDLETAIETAGKEQAHTGPCRYGEDHQGRATICIPAASFADLRATKDVRVMKGFFVNNDQSGGNNQQIYLPPFQPQGTTILRGGTWKDDPKGLCSSGARLLSGGYGQYENWGLRAAMTYDEDDSNGNTCPEPTLKVSLNDDNTIVMEFVYIPPGEFVMGGTSTTDGRFQCVEVPHHTVKITKGFYLGKYPVTQDQYQAVRGGNPSKSTKDPNCPVDNINADDAGAFCRNASEATGADIRLPTEAEWEYAARGTQHGTSADPRWFFGDDASAMDEYAWHKANAGGKSHPVGAKKPNPFGLYDVYGNVCERVSDTYKKDYYAEHERLGVVEDPTGPSQGVKSMFRYEVQNVPASGNYILTARVCTVTVRQRLSVSLERDGNGGDAFVLEFPYTIGEWGDSQPVVLPLNQGDNTLYFWRDSPPQYGVSIKEFTLTKAN